MPEFAISADHPALPGHFPGNPVVPGVVILERVIALWTAAPVRGLDGVKFHHPLQPGETATVRFQDPEKAAVKFSVTVNDRQLVTGRLLFERGP